MSTDITTSMVNKVTNIIRGSLEKAIKGLYGLEDLNIHIEHPNNEDWGDYASNIPLLLAKELRQSPLEIAKNVSYEITNEMPVEVLGDLSVQVFKRVYEAAPGFVNFVVSDEWLYTVLSEVTESTQSYGATPGSKKKRIALEHSNVNPNKAAHVGHLRNACIGQFLERSYEYLGYDVEVQYYANDIGVQVATSALGIQKVTEFDPTRYEKFDHYAWDVYSVMESQIAEDENLKKEREEFLLKLEDVNSEESKVQVALANKILLTQLETFKALDIDYDVIIHEKDIVFYKMWETVFELLKKNPNVYLAEEGPSKGCWLVSMGEKKQPTNPDVEEDKIIVRSNGVPTYTGKDIAYHMWKFGLIEQDFNYELMDSGTQTKDLWTTTSNDVISDISFSNVDLVFDVVDKKQTYAIDTVKKSLEFLGYAEHSQNMTHINYGFVYLSPATAEKLGIDISDGKDRYGMSGRKGWGIKIDDLIRRTDDSLMAAHGAFDVLNDVRNGAIKFEMLKYNTFQDVVFDLDSALNINGFSGPYVQYTHARAVSIMSKYGKVLLPFSLYAVADIELAANERAVLRTLYQFPEVVEQAAKEFAPNLLCNYLFTLAQRYNTFYNDNPILTEKDEAKQLFRLHLNVSVAKVLKNGLFLLGINSPDKI